MGLSSQMVRVILHEHKYKPISGSALLIGRQTVPLTPVEAKQLIQEECVSLRSDATINIDNKTRNSSSKGFIYDAALFSLFCDANVKALDVSDYEGAEIVCNLNDPIPDQLVGQFDFIYNGSCLDNIFDPATSIKNLSRLLRPGGRIIHVEHGSSVNGPYLMYPPDWFYDYYAVNNFVDCKVYVAFFKKDLNGEWDTYSWDPVVVQQEKKEVSFHWGAVTPLQLDSVVITVAEKGQESTWSRSPVQCQYRSPEEQNFHAEAALRFSRSARPKVRPRRVGVEFPKYSPPFQPNLIPSGSLARHPFGSLPWIKTLVKKVVKPVLRRQPVSSRERTTGIPPSFTFCRTLT